MKLPKDFEFLTSTRFWAGILVALARLLEKPDPLSGEAIAEFIVTIAGWFTTINTIDRFSVKKK